MASTIFTGASRYSTDFQSVIDRTVNIASLPMLQMQQNKVTISDQSAALNALDTKYLRFQTSLKNLGRQLWFAVVLRVQLGFIERNGPKTR